MLMNLLDEQYTRTPFYGVPKMTAWLRRQGHQINPKRIRRLMQLMGIEAIYPKPRLSKSHKKHIKYTYLLRELTIDHPNQVWCVDITYIRMLHGFVYLVAHIRLVQPVCPLLEAFYDVRDGILHRDPTGSPRKCMPWDIPGYAVYESGIYEHSFE